MSLTLNIVEHELQAYGTVCRPMASLNPPAAGKRSHSDNPSFDDLRLYLGPESLHNEKVLYLCDNVSDAQEMSDNGFSSIYVNPDSAEPCNHSLLSVIGGEDRLVVFNALLDTFNRFEKWEKDMDRLFFTGGSLQDVLDISSGFLHNNVVVVDPALKLLAYTSDIPCDDPITMELINHGYHTEDNIRKFKLHKRFDPWAKEEGFIINDSLKICKYVTIVRSFKTHSSFSLIIVMMCNIEEPSPYLFDAYEMLAQRVKLFAERDYPDNKPAGSAADTFLRDLFTGEVNDAAAIRDRSKHAGIPFDARFCLFCIDTTRDMAMQPRLLSDVSRMVAPAKTILIDNAIAVLCFNCVSDRCALHCASGTCPLGHLSISARLNEMMGRYDLVCGRSSKFTSLSKAPIAFQQAREACRIGTQKLGMRANLDIPHNWSRIFSFDSCCIDYLIEQALKQGDDLVESTYAGYVIEEIAQQDAASKTDNYTFLYTYLMCERRASVVAETLHMHRNNVKYRIDRIEDQFGIDTDDPKLRFDFLLAFRLREAAIVQKAQ